MQNTFEANRCACQRSSLEARVFPAMARVRPVPQRDVLASASTTWNSSPARRRAYLARARGNETGEDSSMGKSSCPVLSAPTMP
jgi:hypothetical protein